MKKFKVDNQGVQTPTMDVEPTAINLRLDGDIKVSVLQEKDETVEVWVYLDDLAAGLGIEPNHVLVKIVGRPGGTKTI